jgi:hypothetical protein
MTLKRIPTNYGHRYTLDGRAVPGVTTLISKGLPKPALPRWAAKVAAEYAADNTETLLNLDRDARVAVIKQAPWTQRDQAAVRGTDVHALADKLIHGTEVDVPEHLAGHVEAYVTWLDRFDVEPILTEQPVASRKWWYAGTFDAIVRIGGETLLLDWKTSKGVYGETALQTAAYANAEFYLDADGNEQPLPKVDGLGVVHVRADGADFYRFTDPDAAWKDYLHVAWVGKAEERIKSYMGEAQPAPTTLKDAS